MYDHPVMAAPVTELLAWSTDPPVLTCWVCKCCRLMFLPLHAMHGTTIHIFFLSFSLCLFCFILPCPLPPPHLPSCHCSRCERLLCNEPEECLTLPLRITYYYLTFPTNIPVSTNIFRMGPSHIVAEDDIQVVITAGNEGGFFKTARVPTGGVMSVAKVIDEPQDFDLSLELRLRRYGRLTTYLAKVLVFVTPAEPKLAYNPHPE